MRKILISILLFSAIALPLHAQTTQEKTKDALQGYMTRFPQSQLCDVYKFYFQDIMGIEHLLTDSMAAVRYIENEMTHADSADWQNPLFYYPTGVNGNYIRVDINYIRSGIIPMDVFVSAMLRSVRDKEESVGLQRSLRLEWRRTMNVLKTVEPQPLNWHADSLAIERLMESGGYAMRHSALFNRTYRQHYRIIRRDIFEQELLPFIMNVKGKTKQNK